MLSPDTVSYVGIAEDEPKRLARLDGVKKVSLLAKMCIRDRCRTVHRPRFCDVLLHRFSDLLHAEGQGGHPNEVPEKVRRRTAFQDGKVIFVAVYRVNKNRGYTVMAVSYTHLDVYKRQILSLPSMKGLLSGRWKSVGFRRTSAT